MNPKPTISIPKFLEGDLGRTYSGPAWYILKKLDTQVDLILDPKRFFREVNAHRSLEILTYTYSYAPTTLVRRLVLGKPFVLNPSLLPNPDNVRRHDSLHTKLFLGYGRTCNLTDAYIGSQNCTAPTTYNVMFHINNRKTLSVLREYFDHIWNEATPYKECKTKR